MRMKSLLVTLAFLISAVATPVFAGPTLDAVKARGHLTCAVNGARAGMSAVDSKGHWSGLDVDTCRAVAAAVFGDSSKVQFVPTTTQTRFTVLQTGKVDITAANATWTLSREATLGLEFMPTTFYDAQGFMVNRKLGIESVKGLDGATVCVRPGSTSAKVVNDVARTYGLHFETLTYAKQEQENTAFFSGRCNVMVQSTAGLAANRLSSAPNPDEWVILPERFGEDPEGPVVREDDPQWANIVSWTIYAMIRAEGLGVTSKNVDDKLHSSDATVQRLLGVTGGLGEKLGLDNQWAYHVITQVGNYGEVYKRNLGLDSPLKIPRGLNRQWNDGGLLYAPPFK